MKTFYQWLNEGKREVPQNVKDFIDGKTNSVTLQSDTNVARGHQSHLSGSGAHDNRPKRQRTRQDQKRAWQKDQD